MVLLGHGTNDMLREPQSPPVKKQGSSAGDTMPLSPLLQNLLLPIIPYHCRESVQCRIPCKFQFIQISHQESRSFSWSIRHPTSLIYRF